MDAQFDATEFANAFQIGEGEVQVQGQSQSAEEISGDYDSYDATDRLGG